MKYFPRLLLRNKFELVDVNNEVIAVSIGDSNNSFKGTIVLKNESTRFMFEKLQDGTTLPELVKACKDKYSDSTIDEVGSQVVSFLDQLKDNGVLVIDKEHGVKMKD